MKPIEEDSPFTTLHDLLSGDEDARACRDIDDAACREQPRNVGIHVAALSLTKIGDGIADAKLILSWLLSALGAPATAVALLVPVREALSLLPQLAIAARLRRCEVRKWFWAAGAGVQGVALLAMAAVAMTTRGALAGWLLVALLAVFSLARGVCSVAHKDVLGKTVSKGRRGIVGGQASRAAGVAVVTLGAVLLLTPEQGRDIGFLAGLLGLGGILWIVAAGIFASLAEYPGATEGGANALTEARKNLALIGRDGQLALFLATRALLAASALMAPFVVLLAREMGHQGLTDLGMLVLASGAAGAVSAAFWGRFSDRTSRLVMASAGALAALSGLAAATVGLTAPDLPARGAGFIVAVTYFLLAVAHTGIRLGRKTHLVDMAGSERRVGYVAVSNTLIGIVLLVSGAFGALAEVAGTAVTVAVLAVLCLAGSGCALALTETQPDTRAQSD